MFLDAKDELSLLNEEDITEEMRAAAEERYYQQLEDYLGHSDNALSVAKISEKARAILAERAHRRGGDGKRSQKVKVRRVKLCF